MITLIALAVTLPFVAVGIPTLQARLEAWDYQRRLDD
jgi:hypothetical protein